MEDNFILESAEVLGYIVEYAIDTRDYSMWLAYTGIAEVLSDISNKDVSKTEDCNKIFRGISTLPDECFLYKNEVIYVGYLPFIYLLMGSTTHDMKYSQLVDIELYSQAVSLMNLFNSSDPEGGN